jgi:hypothetical protein
VYLACASPELGEAQPIVRPRDGVPTAAAGDDLSGNVKEVLDLPLAHE